MSRRDHFPAVFAELKPLLARYEGALVVKKDEPDDYYLDTPHVEEYGKELFFGAVQIKKSYVSYHLMPVYMFPDLLDDLPEILRKRMQGKSCFNFKTIDEEQKAALDELTRKSFERLRSEGIL